MILLQRLVIEIINFFEQNVTSGAERAVVEHLKSIPLNYENFVSVEVQKIPKETALKRALLTISDSSLKNIRECIYKAYSEIQWKRFGNWTGIF